MKNLSKLQYTRNFLINLKRPIYIFKLTNLSTIVSCWGEPELNKFLKLDDPQIDK